MASALISRRRLADGAAPRVCAQSGGPSDVLVDVRYGHVPRWTWPLIALGASRALLVRCFDDEQIPGSLPLARSVIRAHRLLAALAWAYELAALLLLAWAFLVGPSWLAWFGLFTFACAALGHVLRDVLIVRGYPQPGGRWVRLERVNPWFAAALNQAEAPPRGQAKRIERRPTRLR